MQSFDNIDPNEHVLFWVKKYKCYDAKYIKEKFLRELDEMINILRFLCAQKTDRSYIDRIKKKPSGIHYYSISKTKTEINYSAVDINDMAIHMDKTWFDNVFADKIMKIFVKDNKSKLEDRIIRSLVWCGRSIEEYYLDISCAEIVFAFESIFKYDKSLVSQSIRDQISEATALILCENYDDISQMIQNLKKFYDVRSAIAHGGAGTGADLLLYNETFNIFKSTIIKLLEDDKYNQCNSIEELKVILDKRKYS